MTARRRKPIRWLHAAAEDLAQIAEYITSDAPRAGAQFVENIFAKVDLLGDSPHLGSICPWYRKARQLIHGSYLVYYTVHRKEIVVRAVVHGARLFRSAWLRRED